MCSTDAMFISLEKMFASIVVRRSVETLCSESKDVFLLERSGKYNEHSLKWAHCKCAVFEAGLALFKGYNGGLTFRSNANEVMFMCNQRICSHWVVACLHVGKRVDRLSGLKFSLTFLDTFPNGIQWTWDLVDYETADRYLQLIVV